MILARPLLALALAGTAVGCSAGDSASTVTTIEASLDDLALDAAGYRLEVTSLGDTLRRTLLASAPVGAGRTLDVALSGPDGAIRATLGLQIISSMADGSAQTAQLTIEAIEADDTTMDFALQPMAGSLLEVERDQAGAVTDQRLEVAGEATVTPSGAVAFWAERALEAPISLAGPFPTSPVGEGATWNVTTRDAQGVERARTARLVGLDGDRYVVEIEGPDDEVTVVEGRVGQPLPERQQRDVDGYTTMVLVRS